MTQNVKDGAPGGDLIRVQVKSSTARNGTGYLCQFRRNYLIKEPYSIDQLDIFAMYVIPEKVWYLIPASVILNPPRKSQSRSAR